MFFTSPAMAVDGPAYNVHHQCHFIVIFIFRKSKTDSKQYNMMEFSRKAVVKKRSKTKKICKGREHGKRRRTEKQ